MNWIKENILATFIYIVMVISLIVILNGTWKYSNYALYDRVNILESHLNIAGQKISDIQYQVDVLAELQRNMK